MQVASRVLDHLAALDGAPSSPAARAWADLLRAEAGEPLGWSLGTLDAAWRAPLSAAGVPLLASADAAPLRVVTDATRLRLHDDGSVELPPLELFRTLTSLPLKPLRQAVALRFAVRLQVAAGVHLRLFRQRVVLLNASGAHRGGFLHGPRSGMRTVIALDPDAVLVQSC